MRFLRRLVRRQREDDRFRSLDHEPFEVQELFRKLLAIGKAHAELSRGTFRSLGRPAPMLDAVADFLVMHYRSFDLVVSYIEGGLLWGPFDWLRASYPSREHEVFVANQPREGWWHPDMPERYYSWSISQFDPGEWVNHVDRSRGLLDWLTELHMEYGRRGLVWPGKHDQDRVVKAVQEYSGGADLPPPSSVILED